MSKAMEKLLARAEAGGALEREEIVQLLKLPGEDSPQLFAAADRVRKAHLGDEVYLRGIIEFSNTCERNCLYCGLRKGNKLLGRYRMADDEVLGTAQEIKKMGIPTVVLQSGEDAFYTADKICRLVERVKQETGLIVTLSIGERSAAEYQAFRQAGADRYLLKHETASMALYRYLRPGCRLDTRLQCLRSLKELDYETGTGNMVGLPDQTVEILADDLLLMKRIDADMLGIGPFIAHPDTPLADMGESDPELTLRVVATARLLTRDTNIPATTAMDALHPRGRLQALQAGANVVMPDFTPEIYRRRYDIYPGRKDTGPAGEMIGRLEKDLSSIGRTVLYSAGRRPVKKKGLPEATPEHFNS